MKETIKKSLLSWLVFALTVIVTWIAYAAISHVNSGDTLTSTTFNQVIDATVPSSAIMAFNLTICPTWWTQADGNNGAPDLRWQFLRWLNTFDNGSTTRSDGNEDPDWWSRVLGSYQADELKSHNHNFGTYTRWYGSDSSISFPSGSTSGPDGTMVTASTGGTETRGKNVAVIFCVKN